MGTRGPPDIRVALWASKRRGADLPPSPDEYVSMLVARGLWSLGLIDIVAESLTSRRPTAVARPLSPACLSAQAHPNCPSPPLATLHGDEVAG